MKETFSKSVTNKWSYDLHKNAENVNDPKHSYKANLLPERCNEVLPKNTKLTMKRNVRVLKKISQRSKFLRVPKDPRVPMQPLGFKKYRIGVVHHYPH